MAELRNTLIRAYSRDMSLCHGVVVVAEVLRRRVAFTAPEHHYPTEIPGAVLIDSDASLGVIANALRRGAEFLLMIRATDELLWRATRADLMAGDYWTIELVPWVEYLRATTKIDDEVIREAHQ